MADWIFQANPRHYDITGALDRLSEIAWRVPQYTGDIRPGDGVFLWRSGKEAGIVGIGTVASPPLLRGTGESERPFVVDAEAEVREETRVTVRVAAVGFVDKAEVAALPELADHQICVAPMGTVFPLTDRQSQLLRTRVGAPFPAVDDQGDVAWPGVFSWKDRRKDAYPLPGGYDEQVDSLLTFIRLIAERRPTMEEFARLIQERFGSSDTNSRYIGLFIRRTGFIDEVAGLLQPSSIGAQLLQKRDDALILALLHQRVRFVGEMLSALMQPRNTTDLLVIANDRYGMGWTTKAQIQRRRGWLQSLGMLHADREGRFQITDAGRLALGRLQLHEPGAPSPTPVEAVPTIPAPDEPMPETSSDAAPSLDEVQALVDEVLSSATDSARPDRFERAIAEAFRFLGFRAVQLGGAGKTDVVADADLGRDHSYRVIIDGKTTAREAVGDHQIDWDTIDVHRVLHQADYVVVAGPAFTSARVVDRARDHKAVLMTASDLVELVRQHAAVPLGLDAYRNLLDSVSGELDLEGLTESVEASQRFLDIAIAALRQIDEHVSEIGPMSARDLYLLLRGQSDLEASEPEIQAALDALASALVGALTPIGERYRPSSHRSTSVRRLSLLAFSLQL